jgi:hypothetical protein
MYQSSLVSKLISYSTFLSLYHIKDKCHRTSLQTESEPVPILSNIIGMSSAVFADNYITIFILFFVVGHVEFYSAFLFIIQ